MELSGPVEAIRLLIAESRPIVRRGLVSLFRGVPDVKVAGETDSGAAVVQRVAADRPDVLLLDYRIPDVPAAEVVKRLTEAGAAVRVLLLSERAEEHLVLELHRYGVAGFLTRRDHVNAFVEGVRAVAHGADFWCSPRVATRLVESHVATAHMAQLSRQEREILRRLAAGQSIEAVAGALGLAPGTLRNKLSRLYAKLEVSSRTEAVAWAYRNGVVSP